jgi:hypothetical protein
VLVREDAGRDLIQGDSMARPMPPAEVERWTERGEFGLGVLAKKSDREESH